MLSTPLFKGLTRPVMQGGLPLPVFVIVNMGSAIFVINSKAFALGCFAWVVLYAVCFVATVYNPHFFEEFFVSHVLSRPNGSSRNLGFDSLGGH